MCSSDLEDGEVVVERERALARAPEAPQRQRQPAQRSPLPRGRAVEQSESPDGPGRCPQLHVKLARAVENGEAGTHETHGAHERCSASPSCSCPPCYTSDDSQKSESVHQTSGQESGCSELRQDSRQEEHQGRVVEDPKRRLGTQRWIEYAGLTPSLEMIKELSGGVVGVKGQREQQTRPDQNEQGEPASLSPGR